MKLLMRVKDMVATWWRDRPSKPDAKGQAAAERVQDELIQRMVDHTERQMETVIEHDPQLAAKIEAAARERTLQLERAFLRHQNASGRGN